MQHYTAQPVLPSTLKYITTQNCLYCPQNYNTTLHNTACSTVLNTLIHHYTAKPGLPSTLQYFTKQHYLYYPPHYNKHYTTLTVLTSTLNNTSWTALQTTIQHYTKLPLLPFTLQYNIVLHNTACSTAHHTKIHHYTRLHCHYCPPHYNSTTT